jgi:glycosyltransferase involved in cell wall biosynthesis
MRYQSVKVTVIATVLNEAKSLPRLLDSLAAQTRQPDQVVVVDGGSTDETVAVLRRYRRETLPTLEVIVEPGANISRGRNVAIGAASGEIIASTDAGVRLDRHWLANLVAPFETAHAPDVVAGFFLPAPKTTFEVALGAAVLPQASDIKPDRFLPSSRSVAFRKAAWQAAGGYPEWLDYCEDLIFDFRLRDVAGPFAFAPRAIAHFRPRGSLAAFFKQYYQYARGDGKADLWRRRHAIRYLTYLVALPWLVTLGWIKSPLWWIVGGLLGGIGMFLRPYLRLPGLWSGLSYGQRWQVMAWIPIIRITGDLAKIIGYPVGLYWRRRRIRHQPEIQWRNRNKAVIANRRK